MTDFKFTPRVTGLMPVAQKDAQVLILGSMPSEISLSHSNYYANPTNRFWRLMAAIFTWRQADFLAEDFARRYAALNDCGIALWDTIGSCIRTGSLDTAIRDAIPNDIEQFLDEHPNIDLILLNGRKAGDMWRRYMSKKVLKTYPNIRAVQLPSTSAANTRFRFGAIYAEWIMALGPLARRLQ